RAAAAAQPTGARGPGGRLPALPGQGPVQALPVGRGPGLGPPRRAGRSNNTGRRRDTAGSAPRAVTRRVCRTRRRRAGGRRGRRVAGGLLLGPVVGGSCAPRIDRPAGPDAAAALGLAAQGLPPRRRDARRAYWRRRRGRPATGRRWRPPDARGP